MYIPIGVNPQKMTFDIIDILLDWNYLVEV